MKTTISVIFSLVAWTVAAKTNNTKVEKRGAYSDDSAYGNQADTLVFQQQLKEFVSAGNLRPYDSNVDSRFFSSLGLQLTPQQSYIPQAAVNYQPLPASVAWDGGNINNGYSYPIPVGTQLLEEPVPMFFDYLIPPAIPPPPFPQYPNTKYGPGYQFPRRITTDVNKNLFYKYPGYVGEGGIVVRLPVANARPTRIVVPQHGPVAMGSGGLGYRLLPGGRIALGSGARGFANLALARAYPLPPRPPYMPSQKTNPFSFPEASPVDRALNTIQSQPGEFTGSLTVFPLANDGINNNPVYNF